MEGIHHNYSRWGRGRRLLFDSLEEVLQERDLVIAELQMNLIKAQQRMKMNADRKRREESFEVGDLVYLKLQPYRQKSLAQRPSEKLSARFCGPFSVIQKVGRVSPINCSCRRIAESILSSMSHSLREPLERLPLPQLYLHKSPQRWN